MAERHFFPEALTSFVSPGFEVMFMIDSLSDSYPVLSRSAGTYEHRNTHAQAKFRSGESGGSDHETL